ncbi:MAG: LysR family transcriptional regulator [Methyloligellaceae bacterium]
MATTGGVDWRRLHTFLTVAEAGSFTRAGRDLNLSQSAVSRQVSLLEETLRTSLFHRNSRGLVLTEAGEDFYETIRAMANKLSMGVARINERQEKPEGPLKITTSVAFGSSWLTSRMNLFHQLYPDISVSLLLVDNLELDLSLRQADCALRFSRQTQLNLVQRYLMKIHYRIFASREYLSAHGTPETLEDLAGHELIVYGDEVPAPVEHINWLLTTDMPEGESREPALRVNSVYGIYRAVESGLGVAALPYYMSERSPNLVEILPKLKGPAIEVFFVYPEELRHSRRIQVVRDFLVEQVKKDKKKNSKAKTAKNGKD